MTKRVSLWHPILEPKFVLIKEPSGFWWLSWIPPHQDLSWKPLQPGSQSWRQVLYGHCGWKKWSSHAGCFSAGCKKTVLGAPWTESYRKSGMRLSYCMLLPPRLTWFPDVSLANFPHSIDCIDPTPVKPSGVFSHMASWKIPQLRKTIGKPW